MKTMNMLNEPDTLEKIIKRNFDLYDVNKDLRMPAPKLKEMMDKCFTEFCLPLAPES